jgi:histidinol phosphatase-like enzyme
MLRPALFIDLAGVLLDAPPRCAPSTGRLPGLRGGVGAALRLLERLDYRIVVLAPCALDRRRASHVLPARICDLLARERVALAACCCCGATHAPCEACPPAPALLLRAAHDFDLELTASWVLARDADFITAGRRAGCRTLQVGGGGGEDAWPAPAPPYGGADGPAAYQARDIVDAALAIVRLDGA